MSSPNRREFGYLEPVAAAFYPMNAAEFRALYQYDNPRAPQYRLEGLASMTDEAIVNLAKTLQMALIEAPERIDELWGAVCEQGRLMTEEGAA